MDSKSPELIKFSNRLANNNASQRKQLAKDASHKTTLQMPFVKFRGVNP